MAQFPNGLYVQGKIPPGAVYPLVESRAIMAEMGTRSSTLLRDQALWKEALRPPVSSRSDAVGVVTRGCAQVLPGPA